MFVTTINVLLLVVSISVYCLCVTVSVLLLAGICLRTEILIRVASFWPYLEKGFNKRETKRLQYQAFALGKQTIHKYTRHDNSTKGKHKQQSLCYKKQGSATVMSSAPNN